MNSLTIAKELLSKLDTVDSLTLRTIGERLARAVVAEKKCSKPDNYYCIYAPKEQQP